MITVKCHDLTAAQLHGKLAEVLAFPDWYGGNLDALYDCLSEVDTDTTLCLEGFDDQRFPGFSEVFEDATDENECLTIILEYE